MRMSRGQKAFNVFNITFMVLLMIVTLYPFYYVICASFSSSTYLQVHRGFLIAPVKATLGAYKKTFNHALILSGFANIFKIMIVALPINLLVTIVAAYFMSQRGMMFKGPIVFLMMFTMFFGGGLIPSYLNIKQLGLYNTLWALILPGCLSIYNAIIMKTAMEAVPESLSESAYIDGATEWQTFLMIAIPLSGAIIAVMALYAAVGTWGSWYTAFIYITDQKKWPLQLRLRQILILDSTQSLDIYSMTEEDIAQMQHQAFLMTTVKYAIIFVACLPMLVLYPFVQKYFVKGVMIGSVKG